MRTVDHSNKAALGVLLILEYIVIAMAFDIQPALSRGGSWSQLSYLRDLGMVAVATGMALVAIGFRPAAGAQGAWPKAQRKLLMSIHAGLMACFFVLTWYVLGRTTTPPGSPAPWLLLWGSFGLGGTLCLLGSAYGPSFFSSRTLKLGCASAAAGTLAVFVGKAAATTQQETLGEAALQVAAFLLRLAFDDVHVDLGRKLLGVGDFIVRVAPKCSGVEGVGLAAVLMPVYLAAFRKQLRFPNALLLIPLVLVAVWLGNSARIATLVVVGVAWDPVLAVGAFHSKLGWTFFCAIVLSVTALSRRFSFFSQEAVSPSGSSAVAHDNPTAAYLLPMMALIATTQLTGLLTEGRDPLYILRILAAALVVYLYRAQLDWRGYRLSRYSVGIGAGVGAAWILFNPDGQNAVPPPESVSLFWLASRAIGSSTLVPLVEELAFRGFLLRRLQASAFWGVPLRRWTLPAIIISSLLFGALHGRWLAATLAGLAYALVQIRTQRTGEAVVAHAISNTLIAVWTLTTDDWVHW